MKEIQAFLIQEGNFPLIDKLHRAECREPGYGTIAVPKQGFSENDYIHNSVLEWLKERPYIHVFNPTVLIGRMEHALHKKSNSQNENPY
jgi:hypothetical protein